VNSAFHLDIIGPEEDSAYTDELKALAKELGGDQMVRFLGSQSPAILQTLLPDYDFFVLPTRHENFGHVIVEAWAAGLPVIISDQTPWCDLEAKGIGWDIPLSDTERWVRVLENCMRMDSEDIQLMKRQAASFAADLASNQPLNAYGKLFTGGPERFESKA
jgi:glycosyltransferase involved in cell wall biosynthesis